MLPVASARLLAVPRPSLDRRPQFWIHGAAGGLANVEGWAKNRGVWAKNGEVWAKIEKVGNECMFVGKGVISLCKENLMIRIIPQFWIF